jgi:hypothetical protein
MHSRKLDINDPSSSPLATFTNILSGEIELYHPNTNHHSIELEARDAGKGRRSSGGEMSQILIKGGKIMQGLSCHIDAGN